MKICTSLLCLTILVHTVNAQDYLITFAAAGASSTVDSVKVENLSQCTSLTVAGTDTLLLSPATGVWETKNVDPYTLFVSPNPAQGVFSVLVESTLRRLITFRLSDLSGKILLVLEEWLEGGKNRFTLSGIPHGFYILEAGSENLVQSVKLISTMDGAGSPYLVRGGSGELHGMDNPISMHSIVPMAFNEGDTLKLTGKSGTFRTVNMLFPASSQTVIFTFVDCTDADSIHYAVVQIGSQLWMGENVKTTKYRDGSDIPNVTDSATWANLTTGAYCNFHNLPDEGELYGRLYNFYAVDDSRNICPVGWHVPSHSEWKVMEKFLDPTVDTTALMGTGRVIGRILKEGCDTRWQYWDTTYGFNSAGFTALCANFRSANGGWSLAPGNNHDTTFWTETAYTTASAWSHGLRWCYSDIYVIFPMNTAGFSVRCVRDN